MSGQPNLPQPSPKRWLPGLGDQAGLSGSCREASSLPWEVGPEVLGGSWTRKPGYSNREGFLQLGWGGVL